MNPNKKYILNLMFFTLMAISAIATVSYIYDPASIYREKHNSNSSPDSFAEKLVQSETGLLWPNNSWNERDIKMAIAKKGIVAECAILGSSHAMQLSTYRKTKSLSNICSSLINLSVSGGSLEDDLALSFELLNNESNKGLKHIIIAIDPWTLDFNRDLRWKRYSESYNSMKSQLSSTVTGRYDSNPDSVHLLNLINPSYFLRSLQQIGKAEIEIITAPHFSHEMGTDFPVFLPDASLIYSREYITKKKVAIVPIGGTNYYIKQGKQFSEQALKTMGQLVNKYRDYEINPIFVLTPYHPNVWVDEESRTTLALIEVERRLKDFAKNLGVKVLGSYNPKVVGCKEEEFYDEMHAKDFCLSKIVN